MTRLPERGAGVVHFRPEPPDAAARPEGALPQRYEIRERDDGRVLLCHEAPGLAVSIDRRYAFSEAEVKKLGERVILLDGAGQLPPLIDDNNHVYNLDHHSGCLRAFTLATCEQALIVVLKGLELDKGDWTIYANEPDLDTVFAIWVLLNHRRVRRLDAVQRDAILPLLRLEGAIDANGFEIAEYCGLPQTLLRAEKERLDQLHQRELEIKRSGAWADADLAEYVLEMLSDLDRLVYQPGDFDDDLSVEEVFGHVEVGDDRVAVVCRDSSGIYEVERRLKKVWGDRLGIIALEREPNHYTLRRTASLAGIALDEAYDKLNLLDPRIDGRPPEKRWGGSDDIGGSPRPDGTGLSPREIGKILKLTYKRTRPLQKLQRFATSVLWTALLVLAAGIAVVAWRYFVAPVSASTAAAELALGAAIIGLGAWILTHKLSRGWIWLFGWRAPAGKDWLAMVPPALLGAAFGGVWVPRPPVVDPASLVTLVAAITFAALALELAFRGLLHGLLILEAPVQRPAGPWFVSLPIAVSALVYGLLTAAASRLWIAGPPWALATPWALLSVTAAAVCVGLALGMMRERSLSIWPGVITVFAGALLRLGAERWLGA